MKLHLLVDTCVWLDLAKDYRQLSLLEAMFAMTQTDEIILILPDTVVAEFERNKDRVVADSKRSLSSQFRLVREAIVQFAPEEGRDATLAQLSEVDHRIAIGGEAINDAVELIDKLFATATQIPLTDELKVRVADRAIAGTAPFHRSKNSAGDAIIIETYIDVLGERADPADIYAFASHNIKDFSQTGGDTRLPHPDIANLFDGSGSRYVTNVAALLSEFAGDLVEEIRFEREFTQEPRKLSELLEAEHTLFRQIWYNRHWNARVAIERGKDRIVSKEEWDRTQLSDRQRTTLDSVWEMALAAAKRTEEELGPDNIGPWDDFAWGMLNGKLSALRWVLGDEWDMLDT